MGALHTVMVSRVEHDAFEASAASARACGGRAPIPATDDLGSARGVVAHRERGGSHLTHGSSRPGRVGVCVLAGALSLAAAGCAISPKPEPPMDPGPQVNLGQVEAVPGNGFGPWIVTGGPGAASPAGAEIHVTNLEMIDDPVVGLVAADGSFEVEIFAEGGDEVRLQLITELTRSAPVDFLVGASPGAVSPAPRPLASCLLVGPALELDTSVGHALAVYNGCADSVQIEQPSLRRPVAALDVTPTAGWPATLASGESLTLSVSFTAPEGAFEEIVFVRASAPQDDRRPITVWPTAP